jgi:hypothetical protein
MAKKKAGRLKAKKRVVKDITASKAKTVKGGAISSTPRAVKLS